MKPDQDRLILLHLPRTAGASVRSALGQVYDQAERAYVYPVESVDGAITLPALEALDPDTKGGLRLVVGQVPFGVHRILPGRSRYVTIVRHPIDRVLSMYAAQADLAEVTLEDWLATEPAGADNGMVRSIAGASDVPFGEISEEVFEIAAGNLTEGFDAVLVRGRIGEARATLSRVSGRPVGPIPRLNASRVRPDARELPEPLRKRISELNRLDARLFAGAIDGSWRTLTKQRPSAEARRPIVRLAREFSSEVSGDDPTLLFMHIAKTGGTSMRKALADAYRPEERAFIYEPADLRGAVRADAFCELPSQQRNAYRLLMGHFPYGLHECLDRPFRYATVVRDPVDRVVSLYYHYRHLRGLRIGGRARQEQTKLLAANMSLQDWVFGQQRLATDNGMVRNLAGRRRVPFGRCPDDLLDEALEHVERHFGLVLTVGQLDASPPLLRDLTGRDVRPVGRDNVNAKRSRLGDLDPEVLRRIRELNRLDVELYDRIERGRLDR